MKLKLLMASLAILFAASAFPRPAMALPILQMYIEGARYDQDTETWISNQSNLNLWVIGNVGEYGPIVDVQLAAAFLTGETGSISITPSSTTLLPDPSVSATPVFNPTVGGDGTTPLMSSGDPLPDHGIYGSGVSFSQWGLGDFSLTDSAIGDFSYGFPTSTPTSGQINVYSISITGYSMVHFDTFNHVESPSHVLFGPYSEASAIPEPTSMLLLAMGLAGAVGLWGRRRDRAQK